MVYNVLTNDNLGTIITSGFLICIVLGGVFANLAQKDPSKKEQHKGFLRKIIPWIVLCAFLSETILLISRLLDYLWDVDATPSQASALRELQYNPTGFVVYGWANDYQLPILSSLTGAILWFCWTVYAFNFKSSDTSWWKKICKVIAYIIISITILGFHFHQLDDLWLYIVIIVVVIVLLKIAHVKPEEQYDNIPLNETSLESSQSTIEETTVESENTQKESAYRFITNMAIEEKRLSLSNEESQPIEKENAIQEVETLIRESDMMYCKYCGKRIEADSSFCKYCGKKL